MLVFHYWPIYTFKNIVLPLVYVICVCICTYKIHNIIILMLNDDYNLDSFIFAFFTV